MCISTIVGGEDEDTTTNSGANGGGEDMDFEYAQATIREFWGRMREGKDFGKSEVKEVLMVPKNGGRKEEQDAVVRMWCDILRLRG